MYLGVKTQKDLQLQTFELFFRSSEWDCVLISKMARISFLSKKSESKRFPLLITKLHYWCMLYIVGKCTYYFILTGCFDTIGCNAIYRFRIVATTHYRNPWKLSNSSTLCDVAIPFQNHCYIDIREGFFVFPHGKNKKKHRVNFFKSLHHTQMNVRQQ